MLFNIHTLQWDAELCRPLDIPMCLLPEPKSNSEVYGRRGAGLAGTGGLWRASRSAAARGPAGGPVRPGLLSPRAGQKHLRNRLLHLDECGAAAGALRQRPGDQRGLVTWAGRPTYALEGSVFNAGSTIQWLRDELGLIQSAPECDRLAESVPDSGGVCGGPGLYRAGRALLGYVRPGHHGGPDPGQHQGAYCPGGAGVHRLPGDGSGAGDECRMPPVP